MMYETHITYHKPDCKDSVFKLDYTENRLTSIKVIETEIVNDTAYCVSAIGLDEVIGFSVDSRRKAYKIALDHCKTNEDNPNLMHVFTAHEDRKNIIEVITRDYPEILI